PPQLMMSFTGDNQLSSKALKNRDERLNVCSAHKREARAKLQETYKCDPCADHWSRRDDGMAYQCDMKLVERKKNWYYEGRPQKVLEHYQKVADPSEIDVIIRIGWCYEQEIG
ncbi:13946_t:CDS:2, partial [Racocetra persica]